MTPSRKNAEAERSFSGPHRNDAGNGRRATAPQLSFPKRGRSESAEPSSERLFRSAYAEPFPRVVRWLVSRSAPPKRFPARSAFRKISSTPGFCSRAKNSPPLSETCAASRRREPRSAEGSASVGRGRFRHASSGKRSRRALLRVTMWTPRKMTSAASSLPQENSSCASAIASAHATTGCT